MKRCIVTPENECEGDPCFCAPAGMKHAEKCAIRSGTKCDCDVARALDPDLNVISLLLNLQSAKRHRQQFNEENHAMGTDEGDAPLRPHSRGSEEGAS